MGDKNPLTYGPVLNQAYNPFLIFQELSRSFRKLILTRKGILTLAQFYSLQ